MIPRFSFLFSLLCGWLASMSDAPAREGNFDESAVPPYTLPDPLKMEDGTAVTTAEQWITQRRPELLRLFEEHVYGALPQADWTIQTELLETKEDALDGQAIRRRVRITLPAFPAFRGIEMLVYQPRTAPAAPVFLGLSFGGNHAVSTEPDLPISTAWMRPSKEKGVVENHATEASRGTESSRWPFAEMVARGYAVATAYCGDIEPDHADGWKDGIRGAVMGSDHVWQEGEWGCISAWAWGLSRMLDALNDVPGVDASRAAVVGHSRLGKTALWAGVTDERFGLVISNDSGEGGAALKYRDFGETPAIITRAFPHWFTKTYTRYGPNPQQCPVDQHELLALIAPRMLCVASATEDEWADPRGEFLAALAAEPVFVLLGRPGLEVTEMPAPDRSVGSWVRYHLRTGPHNITSWDWEQYSRAADALWKR